MPGGLNLGGQASEEVVLTSRDEIRDEIWDAMMNRQDIDTSLTDLADAALERLERLNLIRHPSGDTGEIVERLRRESQRLFPERMRDGHSYHETAYAIDKAIALIEQQAATIAELRRGLADATDAIRHSRHCASHLEGDFPCDCGSERVATDARATLERTKQP